MGWARNPIALVLLTVILAAGCGGGNTGPPSPKTYPVKGVVKLRDGTPLANVSVYFRPASDAGSPATGEADAEGRFTLHTFHGNARVPGAQEGTYHILVIVRMDRNQSGGGTINLPAPLTVKPADDNEFTLTVDRPRGQP